MSSKQLSGDVWKQSISTLCLLPGIPTLQKSPLSQKRKLIKQMLEWSVHRSLLTGRALIIQRTVPVVFWKVNNHLNSSYCNRSIANDSTIFILLLLHTSLCHCQFATLQDSFSALVFMYYCTHDAIKHRFLLWAHISPSPHFDTGICALDGTSVDC